jgi:hypothetical protein
MVHVNDDFAAMQACAGLFTRAVNRARAGAIKRLS